MDTESFLNKLIDGLGSVFSLGLRKVRRTLDTLIDEIPGIDEIRPSRETARKGRSIAREIPKTFERELPGDAIDRSFNRLETFVSEFLGGVEISESNKITLRDLRRTNTEIYDRLTDQKRTELNAVLQNHILSGLRKSDLKEEFENILLGVEDRRGLPMINQLNLLIHDGIMEYHARTNIISAQEAGVTRMKYVGSIIVDSREFCVANAGKVFSLEAISTLWKGRQWSGKKSDNVLIHRGGFNCRHHWQPVVRR